MLNQFVQDKFVQEFVTVLSLYSYITKHIYDISIKLDLILSLLHILCSFKFYSLLILKDYFRLLLRKCRRIYNHLILQKALQNIKRIGF